MSLIKVLVDGKEREVRGVNQETTTEGIILVLAKATGKTGKLALIEKWRDLERILPSDDCPLKCLQCWGYYQDEVSLILQDDHSLYSNNFNKDAINLNVDNKDLSSRSLDCESQEDFTALQKLKLQRLTRAIEILDLQATCWDNNDEAFLYLTDDEIAEDLEVKLSKALKLQGKELVEFETWENELKDLEQTRENLSKQREIFAEKIADLEERIAEAFDAIDLFLEDLEKAEKEENMLDKERNELIIQGQLKQISKELSQQNALFRKQDHELALIKSSILNLERELEEKNSQKNKLKNDIELRNNDFQTEENFLPKMPVTETMVHSDDNKRLPVKSNIIVSGLRDQADNDNMKSPETENSSVSTRASDKEAIDTKAEPTHNSSQKFTSRTSSSKLHQDNNTVEKEFSKMLISKDRSGNSGVVTSYEVSSKNVTISRASTNLITSSSEVFAENSTKASSDSSYSCTSVIDNALQDMVGLSDGFSSDTSAVSSSPQISTSLSNSPEEEVSSGLINDSFTIMEYVTKNPESDSTSTNESSSSNKFSPVVTNCTYVHNPTKQVSAPVWHFFRKDRNSSSLNSTEHDSTALRKQDSSIPIEISSTTKPSQSCTSRKESFKKLQKVFEKQEEHTLCNKSRHASVINLRKSSFEKKDGVSARGEILRKFSEVEKQEHLADANESFAEVEKSKSSKPVTLLKPVRNNAMEPHLGNMPQPLQENLNIFNSHITNTNPQSKKPLIVAPKPYGSYVASLEGSLSRCNFKAVEKPTDELYENKLKTTPKPYGSYMASLGTSSVQGNLKGAQESCSKPYVDHNAEMESSISQHELKNASKPHSDYVERLKLSKDSQENSEVFVKTYDDTLESKAAALDLNELQNESDVTDVTVTDSSAKQDDSIVSSNNSTLNFNSSVSQKKSKPLAQPYRNHISTLPLSSLIKSKLSLRQSHYSKNHLAPPTALYDRKDSSKRTAMINNVEATEPGIFV